MYKAYDKQDFVDVADAIRAKTGKSAQIKFPTEFVSEIGSISGGGGSANILSGTAVPTASVGSDGDVYLQYGFTGYTPVEYLGVESAGAYINTGVTNAANAYFEVECNWTSAPSDNSCIFGAQTNAEYTINAYNGVTFIGGGYGIYANISTPLVRHKLKVDATKIYIDNVDTGISPNWNDATNRIYYILANNYSNGVLKASNAKVYGTKIWNGEILVRNFIPAKRDSDDVLGLYDLVNNVFYTNAGTGSFVAGEEIGIDSDTINSVYCKVNGVWQDLIGSDIDDVNTGN